MNNTGWIKIHRQILKWEWYHNLNVRVLFFHLLLKANYEDKKWCGKTIKAGQLITSLDHLAAQTGLTRQQTRTALDKLKSTHEINIQTTRQNTLITINNWISFQEDNTQITHNQHTNNTQITLTKEIKKERNKELVVVMGKQPQQKKFIPPSVEEVREFCKERNNGIDAERFWHYYNSKGWKIGKEPMKKWQSAVITWEKQDAKSKVTATDDHIQGVLERMRERNNNG